MIKNMIYRAREAAEIWRDKGFAFFIRRFIYRGMELVLVEKDLGSLPGHAADAADTGLELIEITPELLESDDLVYPVRSEYVRALNYLSKGYGGFALTKGHEVCGYIWYTRIDKSRYRANHPDVRLLGISSEDNSAYMFSMYLNPNVRGKNLAVYLQNAVFYHLRRQGVGKVYGTYETLNIPALWVHRMLNWKEVRKFRISQFIFFKSATVQ